jgi:hypothetical protein
MMYIQIFMPTVYQGATVRRFFYSLNTQLSGEDAEDQNVIHILGGGASSEPMKWVASTACYAATSAAISQPGKTNTAG